MKFKRQSPLRKKARRGFRGYPVATLAFYGPDDRHATKAAVGIVGAEGAEPSALERWFSTDTDVRTDPAIELEILTNGRWAPRRSGRPRNPHLDNRGEEE